MGATCSATKDTFPIVNLRSWKGLSLDKLIAVPLNCFTLPSTQHPLFQSLLHARNEPSVRHWYDLSARLGTENVCDGVDAADYLSELQGMMDFELTSRVAVIRVKMSECTVSRLGSHVTFQQLCDLLVDPTIDAAVVAAIQMSVSGEVRFFMVKSFSNEARSCIMFQLLAMLEHGPTVPSARVVVRAGDTPSLRALQKVVYHYGSSSCVVSVETAGDLVVLHFSAVDTSAIVNAMRLSICWEGCCLVTVANRVRGMLTSPLDDVIFASRNIWTIENACVNNVHADAWTRKQKVTSQEAMSTSGCSTGHLSDTSSDSGNATSNPKSGRATYVHNPYLVGLLEIPLVRVRRSC